MSRYNTPTDLHGSEAKEYWRKVRTDDIVTVCNDLGFTYEFKTPYQIRIMADFGTIDMYPTNGNWHLITKNRRGDFHTLDDIRILFKELS